ncbi:MAG: type I DNA topoisomerase [Patescibacteria group bacterium]|jgi:DNA topoisomerase-1
MNLIIVESPTKAKTISKFLDKKYQVESSFGHIRDLPKSEMGIDIANGFTPKYIIPTKAKKTVSVLKTAAKKAEEIILASDEDREGEAIAWHLAQALNLDETKTKRIVFHEITKNAILEALKKPRQIDHNMVDAQQARRILDRLVGYELSPFLWKKVARGLSAGRVQSVATKLIVEREREIQEFQVEEYWSLSADFTGDKTVDKFTADLYKINNKTFNKLTIKKTEAEELKTKLIQAEYHLDKIEKKQITKNSAAPFTTSTLQQSANRHLGFSAKQTMAVAQKLYEQGYITYMRTDSLNLSPKFISETQIWLKENLGTEYVVPAGRIFKNKSKNAQEAHEAVRPSEVNTTPEMLIDKLDKSQERLYRLIWQRAVASQMPAAKLAATTIDIKALVNKETYIFRANGQILIFPGYLKVWPEKTKEQELPTLTEKQLLILLDLRTSQHSTNPPARYSDASLVKELEKHSIGRPSTYAPTINTIIVRNYVERDENKKLKPTTIAFVVVDLLIKHFPKIVDYEFTAKMEDDLDAIAEGEKKWQPVIDDFYQGFHANLQTKYEEINKNDIMPEEKSNEICDKCGALMIVKTGRYGKFLACSAFPDCRNIKKVAGESGSYTKKEPDAKTLELEKKYSGEVCDKCGSPMKIRVGKYGPFLACSAYPKCKNIKNIAEANTSGKEIACPLCGDGKIVKKFSKRGAFYACNNYPKCKNAYWGEPTGEKCPDCNALLITDKTGEIKCSSKGCGYQK